MLADNALPSYFNGHMSGCLLMMPSMPALSNAAGCNSFLLSLKRTIQRMPGMASPDTSNPQTHDVYACGSVMWALAR